MIRTMSATFGGFCLALIITLAALSTTQETLAQTKSEESSKPEISWRQTETSIALLNRGKVVWQHVHDKKIGDCGY